MPPLQDGVPLLPQYSQISNYLEPLKYPEHTLPRLAGPKISLNTGNPPLSCIMFIESVINSNALLFPRSTHGVDRHGTSKGDTP